MLHTGSKSYERKVWEAQSVRGSRSKYVKVWETARTCEIPSFFKTKKKTPLGVFVGGGGCVYCWWLVLWGGVKIKESRVVD